jgi:phosphate transport system substrate-binding protein
VPQQWQANEAQRESGQGKPLSPCLPAVHLCQPEISGPTRVSAFVEFYLRNAAKLAKEVGYIPLPKQAYDLALERFQKRIVGSMFGAKGAQVGVTIEQLLAAEAKKR